MIERRVEKDEAGFAQAFDGQRGRELDGHAEGFEHVCRAAARGDGAIAVLGHFSAGSRGHQRGAAGDVEGLRPAAAGADAVDELRSFLVGEGQWDGAPAHHVNEAGELRRLFAARGKDGQHGGGFHLRHLAGKDLFEDFGCLLAREGGAIFGERAKQFFHQRHEKSMAEQGRGRENHGREEGSPTFMFSHPGTWFPTLSAKSAERMGHGSLGLTAGPGWSWG